MRSAVVLALSFSVAERALIVGGDALRQIAFGERTEHRRSRSSSALATFSHSEFIAVARLSMKSFLPSSGTRWEKSPATAAWTMSPTSRLDRLFDRLVSPFHHGAGTLAVLVDDRGGHQMELLAADRDVVFVAAGERIEHLALMRGVLVEHVHVGAEQLAGVELRQHLA